MALCPLLYLTQVRKGHTRTLIGTHAVTYTAFTPMQYDEEVEGDVAFPSGWASFFNEPVWTHSAGRCTFSVFGRCGGGGEGALAPACMWTLAA
jgi:hypothetical protein